MSETERPFLFDETQPNLSPEQRYEVEGDSGEDDLLFSDGPALAIDQDTFWEIDEGAAVEDPNGPPNRKIV